MSEQCRGGPIAVGSLPSPIAIAFVCYGVVLSEIAAAQPSDDVSSEVKPDVIVEGVRPTDAGPMPGLLLNQDQIPGNVQSLGKREIAESRALSVGELMNEKMQGVSINDYSGNPFQMDVNYRGFTASPQTGTPQGLSVFFDGIRVNEPFGDVVNWDLIPMNAIERLDVFPGSNPLFGLNTLGGALSVRTRSGFSSHGIEASGLTGSFSRQQGQLTVGANNGVLGGFAALNFFEEDGWRDHSPSQVRQFFGRADWRGRLGVITASALLADNDLIGNGLIPSELYDERRESVFTSPDETQNRLRQFALSGAYDVSEALNITAQVYRRSSDRDALHGDAYEGFDDFSFDHDAVADLTQPGRFLARNGAVQTRLVGGITSGSGVVDGTPIGLMTPTTLSQTTYGGAVQANWNLPSHKFMVGVSIDRNRAAYRMVQRLALIDASHRVYLDPSNVAPQYYAAANDVPGNDFRGTGTTRSAYFSETWSMLPSLHLTLAGRYNRTGVDSDLLVRAALDDLHELRTGSAIIDQLVNDQTRTKESFDYSSFNPQVGINWLPVPSINLYGNVSRGARVPSVVELGCAFDDTLVDIPFGNLTSRAPRSLVSPGCSLPTTLSGDPHLPQIRSDSAEAGARGTLGRRFQWNASVFRTDLQDDIYFVGVGDGKSYFDTVGKTRRQGFEVGVAGEVGMLELRLAYSYTQATFQSTFYTVSPHNSSADFNQNSQASTNLPELGAFNSLPSPTASANGGRGTYRMIRIDPGARLPGIPEHNYNGTLTLNLTPAWKIGLEATAHSSSYVRGNENNLHEPGGTDQETGLYFCSLGGGCATTGLEQTFVRRGRPFTNEGRTEGFIVFDLDTSYRIGERLVLFARISNLFDEDYFSAGRLGVNPFSPAVNGAIGPSGWNYNSSEWQNSTYVGPGAPRGIWFGFTYESR
ncbi:TonB-dependent receptor [Steroidobacter flavus]|uniref:TonB-dependent receptor n=1 Tax=Steroidobacter flavus TaxID=1842136 RepID=A0ABV8SZN4_9GAMM